MFDTKSAAEVDHEFYKIVEGVTIAKPDEREVPQKNRITVLVNMEHVAKYGHTETMRELVYGCNFAVKKGDEVLCPPSPLYGGWRTGVVVRLDSNGYRGPVKNVKKKGK